MNFQKLSVVALTVLVGCGSTLPPKELVDARAAYQSAQKSTAAQQAPAELHVAKEALDQAERSFSDNGEGKGTKDYAYIAIRKAQLSEATARAVQAQKDKETAERDAQNMTLDQLKKAQSDLASTKQNLEKTQDQLERERRAREDAEKTLKQLASVKQESRGMVITLSGGVLFQSNEASLLPSAIAKLKEVADALTKGNPDSNLTVEGHTDSQGQHQYNMELSKKRADAVRDALVADGVAADRITSVGIGPDRPIADNKSAEGRANNRRVEIIVQPPKK